MGKFSVMQKQAKEELPREIVIEILLRLPPKSVLRLRCVSKQWCNTIDEEHFRNLYSHRSPAVSGPAILFFCYKSPEFQGPRLHFVRMSCLGSTAFDHIIKLPDILYQFSMACNGLLCISSFGVDHMQSTVVGNPLTLEYINLPPCNNTDEPYYSSALGYAPSTNEYKVFGLTTYWTHLTVRSYTIGAGKPWREVQLQTNTRPHWGMESEAYFDGKIYWILSSPCASPSYVVKMLLLEVESENGKLIDNVPNLVCERSNSADFVLVKLRSYSSVSLFVNKDSNIEVWVFNDYKKEYTWDLKHRIDIPPLDRGYVLLYRLLFIWELVDGCRQILLADSKIVSYDGQVTSIDEASDITPEVDCLICHGYNPSLVSLKKYGCLTWEKYSVLMNQDLVPLPSIQLPFSTNI